MGSYENSPSPKLVPKPTWISHSTPIKESGTVEINSFDESNNLILDRSRLSDAFQNVH